MDPSELNRLLRPGVALSPDALSIRAQKVYERYGIDCEGEPYNTLELNNKMRKSMRKLLNDRGVRYKYAAFDNFKADLDEQRSAIEKLIRYGKSPDWIADGVNVVLLGPKGTGKDHLAIALAKLVAMETGLDPVWINGLDLFSDMRTLELSLPEDLGKDIIDPYRADILIISDLAPPAGVLSDFCQNSLFKLIDYRYSNRLPTWVTMNVSGGEEAAQRIGHQTVDRLRHGAIVVPCNWPSYRQPLQLGLG